MNTLLCVAASCLVTMALNGVLYVQSAEHTDDNSDYVYDTACPFPVLANESQKTKPAGCSQDCYGGTQELEDGEPCYVIGHYVWGRMTPLLWYNCPLGKCEDGKCKSINETENCKRGKEEGE